MESETDSATQLPEREKKASKPLVVHPVGVEAVGKTPSLTRDFLGENHRVLEPTQTQPPGKQHKKGPILLVGSGRSDGKPAKS